MVEGVPLTITGKEELVIEMYPTPADPEIKYI